MLNETNQNNLMKKVNLTLWSGTLFLILSCQVNNDKQPPLETVEKVNQTLDLEDVTNAPFESIGMEPVKLSVNAEEGGSLELLGGTEIDIPPNAFVDLEGNPIKGDVDILVTEFKSLGDIILGGVNMKYDSAGVNYDFVSAGMFHIDGEQNGKPIEVAQGKSIEYHLGSDVADLKDTPCYNFYSMDEDQNWQYIETKKATENPKYVEQERFVEPEKVSSSDLVIELDMKGVKSFLNSNASVLWKYAGRRPDTINKQLLNEITAENVSVKKTDEHQLSYEIHANIDGNEMVMPVEPVLMGDDLEKAKAAFTAKMEQIEGSDELARNYLRSRYTRSFSLPGFGMYNCDYIGPDRAPLAIEAGPIHGVPKDLCKFYVISKTDNITITYSGANLSEISYNPDADNHILAINPNDEVALVRSTSFFRQLKGKGQGPLKLTFQEIDGHFDENDDFLALINEL